MLGVCSTDTSKQEYRVNYGEYTRKQNLVLIANKNGEAMFIRPFRLIS
jgi:hypothetical protein